MAKVRLEDIKSGKVVAPVDMSGATLSTGKVKAPLKVGVYGDAGAGKTTLAADATEAGLTPIIIDVNDGSQEHTITRVGATQVDTWEKLLAILHPDVEIQGSNGPVKLWKAAKDTMCVLDTITDCQELAQAWVIDNVPHEKGHPIARIEDYGFGKGYVHVGGEMNKLFVALDRLVAAGVHVCVISHCETTTVPNPSGEDYLRWSPMLLNAAKANVRQKYIGWLKHLVHLGLDTAVKNGKANGSGTRTITTVSTPAVIAKSRTLTTSMPFNKGTGEFWKALLG